MKESKMIEFFLVTRNGVPIDPSFYNWDESTRTFSTDQNNLVLDFRGIDRVTFTTGHSCTFITGSFCKFNTKFHCTFTTGSFCTFTTGSGCTFDTRHYCTFKTGPHCMFKTGPNCTVTRHDTLKVIKLEKEVNHIKLNGPGVLGYTEVLPTDLYTWE